MSVPEGIDLCSIPVATKPDGTWDLVHYQTLQAPSIAVCVVLTVLAMFVAGPRIYVNRGHLKLADHFTALAILFSIAYAALICLMGDLYRHDWNTPVCVYDASFAKLRFALVLFSGFVQFFPRAAILLLYRDLFQIHSRAVHIAIWVGLVGTLIANLPNIPIAIAVEAPHPGETWELVLERLSKANAWEDARLWGPIQGGLAMILDIFVFILPIPIIMRLNLTPRRKKQLLAVFSFAFLGVAASIIGFYYKVKLLVLQERHEPDLMWLLGPVNICIEVESTVAIIVGSTPAFSTFMRSHVAESALFQNLRSRFWGTVPTEQHSSSAKPRSPLHGTIGSPFPKKKSKPAYYELSDTNLINTGHAFDSGKSVEISTTKSEQSHSTSV